MRSRAGVKTSRIASAFVAIIGTAALVIGIPLFLSNGPHTSGPTGAVGPTQPNPILGFVILWGVVGAGIVLYHLINAFTGDAPPMETIEIDRVDEPVVTSGSARTTASQLRELEDLKRDHLITQNEYDQKRRQVLDTLGSADR